MNKSCLLFTLFSCVLASKQTRQVTPDDVGDDYDDFASQPVKNSGGANHNLKQVTYSTIQPTFDIPTTMPPTLKPVSQPLQSRQQVVAAPQQLRRGYVFQHYPWDRLPRQYLMRPGMTYVYPPQHQFANYQYQQLPSTYKDPYNIYRTHPGIGYGCGQTAAGGCGYGQQQYQGGCGGNGGGGGCGGEGRGRNDDDEYEDSEEYEDDEENGGKSGETRINKKDPLEDLELEDLEKLSKGSSDDSSSNIVKASSKKSEDDEDLIDEDKRKKFMVKWA